MYFLILLYVYFNFEIQCNYFTGCIVSIPPLCFQKICNGGNRGMKYKVSVIAVEKAYLHVLCTAFKSIALKPFQNLTLNKTLFLFFKLLILSKTGK